jgi:type IV pilus assembly protein PilA
MKMFRKDEGFTLVELMVVVLIIGILVAIAIPIFNAAKGNAQLKSCYANQRTVEGAVQTYVAQGGTAAVDLTDGLVVAANPISAFVKMPLICPASTKTYNLASGTVNGDTAAATWYTGSPDHDHFH